MNGIDTSHYQEKINWAVAQQSKRVEFAIIKATEGVNNPDKTLIYNSTEAHRVGLKIGYYHMATLNSANVVPDARDEVKDFLSRIRSLPKNDLPLALDIETNNLKLPQQKVLDYIKTFFSELAYAGYTDKALYSFQWFLDSNLPKNHGLGDVKLWLACYRKNYTMPRGWIGKPWMWQFSSTGRVPGVPTNVDLNVLF